MVLKLPKIVYFLQIWTDLSKKSKYIKAIYLHPSEGPHHALSEKSMFYRGLGNSSRDIKIKISKKVLTQQKSNKIHQLQRLIFSKL